MTMLYLLIFIVIILIFISFLFIYGSSRNPVPSADANDAQLVNFPKVRFREVEYIPDVNMETENGPDSSFLAVSGGGANGAFGAGFLCGWTMSGTRPDFKIITGVSTGALIAPLAFLGSDYDEILKKCYTTMRTKHILNVKGMLGFGILPILFGESFADSRPLHEIITRLSDEKILTAIAKEHTKGRRLYIGTTCLDSQRFIIWDIGAIAGSGRPDALELLRKVILASASIPGVFPPVYFDVEVKGEKYDEMHVDGGVIAEVFGYGHLFTVQSKKAERKVPCRIYVIRNGKLDTEYRQVPRKFIRIMSRSFSTLMKAHSWNDLIRLYQRAKIDGVDFNYISIPTDYKAQAEEMFDPVEMRRLFDLGFEMAKGGGKWQKNIPYDAIDIEWL